MCVALHQHPEWSSNRNINDSHCHQQGVNLIALNAFKYALLLQVQILLVFEKFNNYLPVVDNQSSPRKEVVDPIGRGSLKLTVRTV